MWTGILHRTFNPVLPSRVRTVAVSMDIVCLLVFSDSALKASASVFSVDASLCCKLVLQDCVCLVNTQKSFFCFSKGDNIKIFFFILVSCALSVHYDEGQDSEVKTIIISSLAQESCWHSSCFRCLTVCGILFI